ncbi:hypothetical protein SC1083_0628 [Aggregatibacter actinomycetemcomitans serotype e str. SC1083]|uniref:GAPS4b N-terminal domain-containing protein n=1 Tax=Aggregatibacter actinomycetemcomitans serotype e str. SC1083 TaxID=907488 RepID=G4A737_AGGAC|nr:hypothetical protein [Aggregatibacter actinomycetemcomitans]EGY34241.1 hypothetical protein SC1083_0628 [Aggregatibacter actinomycetemcomitans serotype e str. SC1083]
MTKQIDLKGLIPSGTELRILLNSNHISYGDISSTLKEKGIFCGNSDKIISVPLLTATLLTSDEYAKIIDNSISRSAKPKNKISSLELVDSGVDLNTPLKNLFSSEFNPFEGIPNIEITKKPNPIFDKNNTIRIKYEIKRIDFSKDFLKREISFEGEILVQKKDIDLKIEFLSTHTSKETETINQRIGAAIAKELKNSGIVKSDVESKITFNAFEKIERVRFFKRLTAGLGAFLILDDVNEIVISREASTKPLPNDPKVSWMNQTVKHMTIDGDRLHNIFLISDEKYYQYYFIDNMTLTYKYEFGINKGQVKMDFFFSSSSKRKDFDINSELAFEIISIKTENNASVIIRKNIENDILEKVRILIKSEYEKIIEERNQKLQFLERNEKPSK